MCLTSQADETAEFKTLFDRMDESSRKAWSSPKLSPFHEADISMTSQFINGLSMVSKFE